MMHTYRLTFFIVTCLVCVAVILIMGAATLLISPLLALLLPVLIILDLPSPAVVIAWLWSTLLTKIMSVMLNITVEVEGEVNLDAGRPVVCVCNHPPTAFFPIVVWAIMTHVRLWVVCVSKIEHLWNPVLGPLVIWPSILMKALIVTKRGNGWGTRMVEVFTRLLVTKYSALFLFADKHRPGTKKYREEFQRMLSVIPGLEAQERLGAYRWKGIYAAMQALGPAAQIVVVTISFPQDAVGFYAPLRASGRTITLRVRDVTAPFQSAMVALDQDEKPQVFINEVNALAREEDRWIVSQKP